jgi:membrane protein CcdC involved in cytochrome C biogenesis
MMGKKRPIKKGGFGIIAPVLLILVLFSFSISQLMHIPGEPFHLPAYWEIIIAILLGILFGGIMLTQTSYEVREDGLIYSKPNKNFKFVIMAIILIRVSLSQYFKNIDYIEFTILTMLLAFFYLCIWRIGSYTKFRKLYLGRPLAQAK